MHCMTYVINFNSTRQNVLNLIILISELQRDGAIYYLIFCRSVWHYPLRLDNPLYIEVVFNQIAPDYLEGLLLVMPGEQIDQEVVYDIAKVTCSVEGLDGYNWLHFPPTIQQFGCHSNHFEHFKDLKLELILLTVSIYYFQKGTLLPVVKHFMYQYKKNPKLNKNIFQVAALLHRAADMDHKPTIKETKFLLPKPALSARDIKPPQWVNMVNYFHYFDFELVQSLNKTETV